MEIGLGVGGDIDSEGDEGDVSFCVLECASFLLCEEEEEDDDDDATNVAGVADVADVADVAAGGRPSPRFRPLSQV